MEKKILSWDALQNLELSDEDRQATYSAFSDGLIKAATNLRIRRKLAPKARLEDDEQTRLALNLEKAFGSRGIEAIDTMIKYAYYGHVATSKFSTADLRNQRNLADLRYPLEWYPKTRTLKRKIHLHVGPTNSGKTYHALKALEAANTGLYAGPLRLLAHEVYTRFNASGKRCQLVTGEERRMPDDDPKIDIVSCTVEMVDCSARMEVAVIDEIQMIGAEDRGWAWTQAFLGVQADELHLCGEERTVPLIKELAAMIGDSLEIHHYKRLSPLDMDARHLGGDLRSLRKGDCIVAFSVLGIHALRKSIEKQTNKKVAIVYGSLPPEVRAQQARLFNDPDNDYDYLVASDAVGMGLNLSIKRIIFESSQKNDGIGMRTLKVSEIKQIGGRAGRYRTAHQAVKEASSTLDASAPEVQPTVEVVEPSEDPEATLDKIAPMVYKVQRESSSDAALSSDSIERSDPSAEHEQHDLVTNSNKGLITTLYPFDFPIIKNAMSLEPEPIRSAGLHPPASIVERFTSYFPPGTPFSYILLRLNDISRTNQRFHLCGLRDSLLIADAIHSVEGLTTLERISICSAPISLHKDSSMKVLLQHLAGAIANQRGGSLLEIPPAALPLELLDQPVSGARSYLSDMERLHKMIIAYLWLSYRFSGVFITRQLAFYVKELIEQRIDMALSKFNFSENTRQKLREAREKNLLEEMKKSVSVESAAAAGESVPEAEARSDDETAETFDEEPVDSEEATEGETASEKEDSLDHVELDAPNSVHSNGAQVKKFSVAS